MVKVVLKSGEVIQFDSDGGMYVEKQIDGKSTRVMVGNADGKRLEIDPVNVLEAKFEQKGSGGGGSFVVGFLVGIPVGVGLLYLIAALAYSGR